MIGTQLSSFDPCYYVDTYLNTPEVQRAFHANVTGAPGPWGSCKYYSTTINSPF